MKTLFLIDPADKSTETITFYLNLFNNIKKYISGKFFYSNLEYSKDKDNYYLDCFNNTVDEKFNIEFKLELLEYKNYDLVFTNSCNDIVRDIFDFVINVSPGIYSRPPFPFFIQLDPWGLYWKSFTFNAPRFNLKNYDSALSFIKKLKFSNNKKKYSLFPFNSEYWPLKIQNLSKTQIEYFYNFESTNENVIWTKKPNITSFSIDHNFDYDYFKLLNTHNLFSVDSSLIIPECKKIWVSHSTLGFQAALLGVSIDSPSCFYYWKNEQIGTIGYLLETVWVNDIKEIPSRLEKLKIKIPKNLKNSFKNINTYINHDTHLYRL